MPKDVPGPIFSQGWLGVRGGNIRFPRASSFAPNQNIDQLSHWQTIGTVL
jgi:hypothetical protein